MSVLAHEESHVQWDVEGWVKAALCNWARDYEEIQIGRFTTEGRSRIVINVEGVPIATVTVRKELPALD